MLEELFTFPVILIDGDNEERKTKNKERFGSLPNDSSEEEEQYDIVFGEAEYPYWDFIGIEDRWVPTTESLDKALKGKFEACVVRFANVGQLLVPWSKKKFKAELIKFGEAYESNKPKEGVKEVKIVTLTPEQYKKATDDGNK